MLNAQGSLVPFTCTADHVVTGETGALRGDILRRRTVAAFAYWGAVLRIRPVLDAAIPIAAAIRLQYGLNVSAVPSADLVMVMTARPSPFVPYAGYATCLQLDQLNRCTVGQFNWYAPSVPGLRIGGVSLPSLRTPLAGSPSSSTLPARTSPMSSHPRCTRRCTRRRTSSGAWGPSSARTLVCRRAPSARRRAPRRTQRRSGPSALTPLTASRRRISLRRG